MGHRLRFLSAADLALAGVAEGAGAEEVVEEMVEDDAGAAVLLDVVEVEAGVAEVVEEMVEDDAGAAVLLDVAEVEAGAAGTAGIAELCHC